MTTATHRAQAARQQRELEADLAERRDAFQSAPEKFTLAVNPVNDGFEFAFLEWAKEQVEVVLSRAGAEALRDWLILELQLRAR